MMVNGSIGITTAPAALIELLKLDDQQIVVLAERAFNIRLPNSRFDGQWAPCAFDASAEYRNQRGKNSWEKHFAESSRMTAVRCLGQVDHELVKIGGIMWQCMGSWGDLQEVTDAGALTQGREDLACEPEPIGEAIISFTMIVKHGSAGNILREEVLAMQKLWLDFVEERCNRMKVRGQSFQNRRSAAEAEDFKNACTFHLKDGKVCSPFE